jgi:hypothetical protein
VGEIRCGPPTFSRGGHRRCAFEVRPEDDPRPSPGLDERPLPPAPGRASTEPPREPAARLPSMEDRCPARRPASSGRPRSRDGRNSPRDVLLGTFSEALHDKAPVRRLNRRGGRVGDPPPRGGPRTPCLPGPPWSVRSPQAASRARRREPGTPRSGHSGSD